MSTIDLGGAWRFRPHDGEDATIAVPGLWEAHGYLELDGLATYEREFEIDEATHATLEFDTVADLCEVRVNGQRVGSHEVGFTPFAFDVTDAIRAGTNTIRVDVNDPPLGSHEHRVTPQGKQGWGNRVFPSPPSVYITYGGIWQPCRLALHGPAYIADLWCDMDPDAPTVGVDVRGEGPVEIQAFGQTQTLDGSGTVRFAGGADVWSPESPVLYEIAARAGDSHSRTIRTGLRRLERSGDDLLVNGKPYRMRSALHQGFWPRELYAADPELIERDVHLALDAGLNTLRTHLKAFEPAWLDAADAAGLLLHCDLPIGEPLRDADLLSDSTFVRRCVIAAAEQVRRDRSRPSIILWTLLNEVGLVKHEMLDTDAYRSLVTKLTEAVRALDPTRPIVENDWVFQPGRLVHSDVRTSHWYGRTTKRFADWIDERLSEIRTDPGPLFVSEFGEWGLPSPSANDAFWDTDDDLRTLVAESGWTGSYEAFVEATQVAQGWADRIQAERFRTDPRVHGFCLTEWTDVPHELNGLVTLRREPKKAIDAFRPALADVAPIALLDRYTYAEGESIPVRLVVSNWSGDDLREGELSVAVGSTSRTLGVPSVAAGGVEEIGTTELPAAAGGLWIVFGDTTARYPVHIHESLGDGFTPSEDGEPVPTTWGPTPVIFTTQPLAGLPANHVLTHEMFDCFPKTFLPGVHGAVQIFIPPPIAKWGAVVTATECTMPETPFTRAVVADAR